ncbi:hypothetical protein BD289DRAFT_486068 [Coniella lustricola]|uniref:RING-type domain-containing protein n=1 Tax=Coniella lustricola TaxID=2025994 RepID=A0A2T2ZWD2_9PEZI|nr:hypothetical protein BD289DRAFT_486068 [Coniella lustricola]
MASNDGRKLLVFGLSFAQHDSRKMQQVLRHYGRLPDNPGSRAVLFLELNKIGRELVADEASRPEAALVTNWMKDGGDFPLGQGPVNITTTATARWESLEAAGVGVGSHSTEEEANEKYHHERYGRGRTLDDPVDAAESNNNVEAADQGQATNEDRYVDGDAAHDDTQHEDHRSQANSEEWDDDSDTRGWTHNAWGPRSAATFRGRGHTLNDAPEQVDEEDTYVHAPPENSLMNDINAFGELEDAEMRFRYGQGRTINDLEPQESNSQDVTSHDAGVIPADVLGAARLSRPSGLAGSSNNHIGTASDTSHDHSKEADTEEEEIECPICACLLPPSDFPRRETITESCTHPDKACLACLRGSIAVVIERGALHLLACPICPAKLSPRDMKAFLASDAIDNENDEDAMAAQRLYKRYLFLKTESEIPGHWISCMSPTCGVSQPHQPMTAGDPKMICRHCSFATCAKHRRPWHEGQTCDEFDMDPAQIERLEEEEATARLLSNEAMSICPKCGQGVTKTEGCDHMQCQCGTSWCYVCSCSWENIIRIGPTAHATFCTYHPNKVSLTRSQQEAARARIMGLVHGSKVSAQLAEARDAFRQRRREEMRPKVAAAAEARLEQARKEKQASGNGNATGEEAKEAFKRKRKVKLVPAREEGGKARRAW